MLIKQVKSNENKVNKIEQVGIRLFFWSAIILSCGVIAAVLLNVLLVHILTDQNAVLGVLACILLVPFVIVSLFLSLAATLVCVITLSPKLFLLTIVNAGLIIEIYLATLHDPLYTLFSIFCFNLFCFLFLAIFIRHRMIR
jgi:hypothetical protein